MKDLAIVIVSYDVRERLRECLESVFEGRGVSFDVCVVDNASADGSAAMVRERYPQAVLIESAHNGGYAYANNLAIRQLGFGAGADHFHPLPGPLPSRERGTPPNPYRYLLLLNPDTRLGPDDLSRCIAFMDERSDVGIMGPKLVREDGSLDLACRRSFPTPLVSFYRMAGLSRMFPKSRRFARYNLTYLDPDETAEVDAVVGAFMLVRPDAVAQAGLLDERFFLYGEDLDWALRIKALGWKVVYYPKVSVLHYKRESSRKHRGRATSEFYRSMGLFYEKHYSYGTPRLLHWGILAAIKVRGAMAQVGIAVHPLPSPLPSRERGQECIRQS